MIWTSLECKKSRNRTLWSVIREKYIIIKNLWYCMVGAQILKFVIYRNQSKTKKNKEVGWAYLLSISN